MNKLQRNSRKTKEGFVISAKMSKTATIRVSRVIAHPRFFKTITRNKTYYAHYEGFNLQEGQKVRIVETRPLSKLKRWRVIEVLA